MGLDAGVIAIRASLIGDKHVGIDLEDGTEWEDLAEWRKFWHLQSWMFHLYHDVKGGTRDLNREDYLRLTEEDLDKLEERTKRGFLLDEDKPSEYWSTLTPQETESIHAFIKKARESIGAGNACLYWCSY